MNSSTIPDSTLQESPAGDDMASPSPIAEKRVRKKRDPQGTREAILEAAREVLAQDGKEGLSVAQVAQLAGVIDTAVGRGIDFHDVE